jgi:hypothetical protein
MQIDAGRGNTVLEPMTQPMTQREVRVTQTAVDEVLRYRLTIDNSKWIHDEHT